MTTLTQEHQIGTGDPAAAPAVQVTNLVKTYPHPEDGTFNAVDDLSFEVGVGEVLGILGPNGAGKSTTLEIIEGLQAPTSGSTSVLGLDSQTDNAAMKTRIGVQLQASSYFEYLTLEELLNLFGSFYPKSLAAGELLDKVGLLGKRKALVGQLSGGQAQRFSIVAAMVNDPDIVFLDEPTTGLDPQARRNLWDLIRSINEDDGKTVVMTTHYMEEAEELSHRVAIIDAGKIQAIDTPVGLIGSLATDHSVIFSTQMAVAESVFESLPGVTTVGARVNGTHSYQLGTESPKLTVPALFQLASVRRFEVDDLAVHAPTLEDVFLNVTGRRLRD
ncbi:MAG: ABC transporter ATP-binding protein [bacterium]|nr:ABC transporter ATP-binding protein [bacterium]MCP4965966.1 ABC transporter ATP-binding protein [bacterium]